MAIYKAIMWDEELYHALDMAKARDENVGNEIIQSVRKKCILFVLFRSRSDPMANSDSVTGLSHLDHDSSPNSKLASRNGSQGVGVFTGSFNDK